VLNKILKQLDNDIVQHAIDSVDRPYTAGVIEFEAGRRHGISTGLRMARQIIINALKDKDHDEAGDSAKAVRRASGSLS